MKFLLQNQKESKISEFYIRINDKNPLLYKSTFNRLRSAQLLRNSPVDILTWDKATIDQVSIKNNLTFNVLKLAISNEFSFRNITAHSELQIEICNRISINTFLTQHGLTLIPTARKRILQLNLFFMEQFINLDATSIL